MKHYSWKRIYRLAAKEVDDAELERHLAECDRCRAEFERARRVIEALEHTELPNEATSRRIARAAWNEARKGAERAPSPSLRWALAPLAVAIAIGLLLWALTPRTTGKQAPVQKPHTSILAEADEAAKDVGLADVKLDTALLEVPENLDIEPEELGVDIPEVTLPELTSSYLVEVLDFGDTDALLKELGIEPTNGQTKAGRLA